MLKGLERRVPAAISFSINKSLTKAKALYTRDLIDKKGVSYTPQGITKGKVKRKNTRNAIMGLWRLFKARAAHLDGSVFLRSKSTSIIHYGILKAKKDVVGLSTSRGVGAGKIKRHLPKSFYITNAGFRIGFLRYKKAIKGKNKFYGLRSFFGARIGYYDDIFKSTLKRVEVFYKATLEKRIKVIIKQANK